MKKNSAPTRLIAAWNDFWFAPEDPLSLGLMRVLVGGMLVYTHFVWGLNLEGFFGPEGWHSIEAVEGFYQDDWLPSFWWSVPVDQLRLVHVLCFVPLVMFLFGVLTPVTSVLALAIMISNSNRAPLANYGMDQILSVLMLSLVIGDSGGACSLDAWRRKRRWLQEHPEAMYAEGSVARRQTSRTRLATRLIQIHFCIIYFFAGISKLQGEAWWNGEAIWRALANQEYQSVDMTWLAHYPWALQLATHATIFWEISFAFLVWNRFLRPFVLAIGLLIHAGIGLCMGMITFGLIVIFGYLAYVPPERLQSVVNFVRTLLTGRAIAAPDSSRTLHPFFVDNCAERENRSQTSPPDRALSHEHADLAPPDVHPDPDDLAIADCEDALPDHAEFEGTTDEPDVEASDTELAAAQAAELAVDFESRGAEPDHAADADTSDSGLDGTSDFELPALETVDFANESELESVEAGESVSAESLDLESAEFSKSEVPPFRDGEVSDAADLEFPDSQESESSDTDDGPVTQPVNPACAGTEDSGTTESSYCVEAEAINDHLPDPTDSASGEPSDTEVAGTDQLRHSGPGDRERLEADTRDDSEIGDKSLNTEHDGADVDSFTPLSGSQSSPTDDLEPVDTRDDDSAESDDTRPVESASKQTADIGPTTAKETKPSIAVCDPDWAYRSFAHYLTRRGFPTYVGTSPVSIWRFVEAHGVEGAVFFVDRMRTREFELLLRDLTLSPLNELPVVIAIRRRTRIEQALAMQSERLSIVPLPQSYRGIRRALQRLLGSSSESSQPVTPSRQKNDSVHAHGEPLESDSPVTHVSASEEE